ncbi:hypothetical protein ACJMK2_041713 [Sinanodonta woodiana]|uniref:CARD domain-containing protein n=1 Tax=Sinanodonta woodiana TaxID=1069815 RepID=A0ABD3W6W7_SINWO
MFTSCSNAFDGAMQSGLDRQNVMRLRVNRIALVQEMRVEHIIGYLVDNGVLTTEDEKKIESGTSPQDKTRILIDLLPTKARAVDWYRHFREALKNPNADKEVKKRYKTLVEFLDNTLIHRPNSQSSRFSDVNTAHRKVSMKLPHYQPLPPIKYQEVSEGSQNNLNLEEEQKTRHDDSELEKGAHDNNPEHEDKVSLYSQKLESMTLVKGYFQQWIQTPDNFRSLIQVPEEHLNRLQMSSSSVDQAQLQAETKALEKMRKLELIAVLARRKLLPSGFELCMCDIVEEILQEANMYHLYFKYFKLLLDSEVNLLQDILTSFYNLMISNSKIPRNQETVKQFTKLSFNFVDFLTEFSYFADAERIMTHLMAFLSESHHLDIWMLKYKGYIKLMHLRNRNYDFVKANTAYRFACELKWQIQLMSFGQDILNEAYILTELSTTLLEMGSINPAFAWSQKAMKVLDPTDYTQIINTLCCTVMTYCSRWQIKRAETLAVEAVQMANQFFGQRHPLYLKALLTFCHFSSEFKQDEASLTVAKFTLETAKKIYACETLQLAFAHRALSKAHLVLQKFDDEKYFFHAKEALRIARTCLTESHPLLYLFLHTSASALQWKALHSSKEVQDTTLRYAETDAHQALILVSAHYGELSLRGAQMYSLLGQIYSKMDRLEEAEDHMMNSLIFMKLCQPENSYFRLLAAATLGTFYKIVQKPKDAVAILKNVLEHIESPGVYMKWVHACFEHLINTLQALNRNKEADEIQIKLSQWIRDNPPMESGITIEILHDKPKPFSAFMQDFNIWEKRSKKVLNIVQEKMDEKQIED